MNNINLINIFKLSLFLFLLLPGFMIPGLKYLPVFLPIVIMLLIFILILNIRNRNKLLADFINNKYVKPFFYFFLFSLLSMTILFAEGRVTLSQYLYMTFIVVNINIIAQIAIGYFLSKNININIFYKYIFYLLLTFLLYGTIQFIAFKFNISFLLKLDTLLNNEASTNLGVQYDPNSSFMVGGIPRIKGTFKEPSTYAYFLLINLPFAIFYYFSNFKINKNILKNKLLKAFFIILYVFNFLFTQSPIFLVLGVFLLILYLYCLGKIKLQNIIIALFPIIFFLYIIYSCPFDGTFLHRIHRTLRVITNFNAIIIIEPSLGTRLVQMINSYTVFIKNPILGTGIGNMNEIVSQEMVHSIVPLTGEIVRNLNNNINVINPTINTKLLVEYGLIATLIYYFAFLKFIKDITKNNKSFFIFTFKLILIFYIILSFYNSSLYFYYIYILLGFFIGYKKQYKEKEILNGSQN